MGKILRLIEFLGIKPRSIISRLKRHVLTHVCTTTHTIIHRLAPTTQTLRNVQQDFHSQNSMETSVSPPLLTSEIKDFIRAHIIQVYWRREYRCLTRKPRPQTTQTPKSGSEDMTQKIRSKKCICVSPRTLFVVYVGVHHITALVLGLGGKVDVQVDQDWWIFTNTNDVDLSTCLLGKRWLLSASLWVA